MSGASTTRGGRLLLAAAAVGHESVDLAAWKSGERQVSVLGVEGRATITWKGAEDRRLFAYEPDSGDPLALLEARHALARSGRLDPAGFAGEPAWFDVSADRVSSLGFLMTSDRQERPKGVISAERALLPWLELRDCVD